MTTYTVNLHWPRSSRQTVYSEDIDARTAGEAKLIAAGRAKLEGWNGSPIRSEARAVREVQPFRQNANAWRRNLDPRDPNYLEAPDDEEVDAQAEIEEWGAECDLMNREDYHE